MTVIAAANTAELDEFGRLFWLNELQPLRGLEGVTKEGVSHFRSTTISDVDTVAVITGMDCGCSREKATILTFPAPDTVDGATLLEAVWAGYMLSLKATMDGGRNRRAHVGRDADAIDLANAIVSRLGGTATPCDEVYGSGGTYLEALDFGYDPATRTLTVDPSIGS